MSDKFTLEELESREMLSGNVNVELDASGILEISGDAEANEIRLFDNESGEIVIRGRNGTQINRSTSSFTVNPRDVSSIKASLKNGDDKFILRSEQLSSIDVEIVGEKGDDDISIRLSHLKSLNFVANAGEDKFSLTQSKVIASVELLGSIRSPSGNIKNDGDDVFRIASTSIDGTAVISSEGNDDFVFLKGVDIGRSAFIGTALGSDRLKIDRSSLSSTRIKIGNDVALITRSRFSNTLEMSEFEPSRFKVQNSIFEKKLIVTSTDFALQRSRVFGDFLSKFSRFGPQKIRVIKSAIDGGTIVDLGVVDEAGEQGVFLSYQSAHNGETKVGTGSFESVMISVDSIYRDSFRFRGDSENDSIYSTRSTFTDIATFIGGDGDDYLSIDSNTFRRNVRISGGAGFDTFNDFAGNQFDGNIPSIDKVENFTNNDDDYKTIVDTFLFIDLS